MKNIFKKCICMALVMCMAASMLMADVSVTKAAVCFSTTCAPEDEFNVKYDSSKHTIYWVSRKKITCKSQYGSMWANLDKDHKLGTATIKTFYLEPREKTGDYYYAMAGCEVSMDPVDLKGNISGMSQLADFRIETINEDSRVCSPTVEVLNIQASSGTNTSSGVTVGTGLKYNSEKKAWEASGKFDVNAAYGSFSEYTYNKTNVSFTQKAKNNGYASWKYDYKSKDGDVTWNEYLMSSSKVAGQVAYRLDKKPITLTRFIYIPTEIYYDIRFGAGNSSSGEVADRLGPSTNRDMSVMTGKIYLDY